MIQLQQFVENVLLFVVGCLGWIEDVEVLEDGCYNIVLIGELCFCVVCELNVVMLFCQVEVELLFEFEIEVLVLIECVLFECEVWCFVDVQGYSVDWELVVWFDDVLLINGVL